MKTALCLSLLICLAACGIKGDLVRPSDVQHVKEQKQKQRNGLLQLPQ